MECTFFDLFDPNSYPIFSFLFTGRTSVAREGSSRWPEARERAVVTRTKDDSVRGHDFHSCEMQSETHVEWLRNCVNWSLNIVVIKYPERHKYKSYFSLFFGLVVFDCGVYFSLYTFSHLNPFLHLSRSPGSTS